MPSSSGGGNRGAGGLRCVLWHGPGVVLPGELVTSLSRRISHISVCTDAFTAMAEVCGQEAQRQAAAGGAPGAGTVLVIVQPEQLAEAGEVVTELRTYAPGTLAWKYDASANPRLAAIVESDVARWAADSIRTFGRGVTATAESALSARTHDTALSSSSTTASASGSSPSLAATVRRTPANRPTASSVQAPPPPPVPGPPARGGDFADGPNRGGPRLRLTDDAPAETPARSNGSAGPKLREVVGRTASDLPAPRPTLTAEEMRMLLGEDPIDGRGERNGHHGREGEQPR